MSGLHEMGCFNLANCAVCDVITSAFEQIASLSHGSEMNVDKVLPMPSAKVSQKYH